MKFKLAVSDTDELIKNMMGGTEMNQNFQNFNTQNDNFNFNISNVNKNEIVEIINVLNRKIGNNVKIEYKSKDILLGTACELEDFVNVEGSV